MNADTPLAFHRRRIAMLGNTFGVWLACPHAACRRAGTCRRAGDVLPACVLPVLREINASVGACLDALPEAAARKGAREESLPVQIASLNKRLVSLLEAQVEGLEGKAG